LRNRLRRIPRLIFFARLQSVVSPALRSEAKKGPASAVSPGGDVFDAVDEGTQLPQKLVLRIVRAEYTKLAD